jgi:alpha-mannosidase
VASDPASILADLGLNSSQVKDVLDGQARLVLLAMSAHMDWDWQLPFPLLVGGEDGTADSAVHSYFGPEMGSAATILEGAADQMAQPDLYSFSVCEMGFLRAFAEACPTAFSKFASNSARVHLCGAGITSPDNLLPHGEAFVRNYLVGRAWAEGAMPNVTISQSYLPDDFGHDPELPVALQAMDMQATGFARLPGATNNNMNPNASADGTQLQATTLIDSALIDFTWCASDGSTVLAHYMSAWYGGAGSGDLASVDALQSYLVNSGILTCSPTRYVYVPMANDFQTPITTVAATCVNWNGNPPLIGGVPVLCASGTFDQFAQLMGSLPALTKLGPGGAQPFYSTPYWCGVHATRPLLKILHQRATRTLLAAEAFGAMAVASSAPVAAGPAAIQGKAPAATLAEAWDLLVPSTHHDFITGTAHPRVYRSEQLPLLRAAVSAAEWLHDDAMVGVAATLGGPAPGGVAVFNALGIPRPRALVECDPHAISGAAEIACGSFVSPVQTSAEGRALFLADLPATGCASAYAPASGTPSGSVDVVSVTEQSDRVRLENARLRVDVSTATGDIISFYDKKRSQEVLPAGQSANAIAIFSDSGNEYVLGCETPGGGTFSDLQVAQEVKGVEIVEPVPGSTADLLRGRVRVTSSCDSPDGSAGPLTYVRDYKLVSGEAMLRMELTGCAPMSEQGSTGTTVMVKLPLGDSIGKLARGTPAHWSEQMPQLVWEGLTTYASHHYAIGYGSAGPLAGVLHADVPAWGLWWSLSDKQWTNDGVLYGAVLRNTNGRYFGDGYDGAAGGTDPEVHTRSYAMIPPSACGDPATLDPLLSGLQFATQPSVTRLNGYLDSDVPPQPAQRSLAQVTAQDGLAVIVAAKLGTRMPEALVLRVYQPTNGPLKGVAVQFDASVVPGWKAGATVTAQLVTSLESPTGAPDPQVTESTATAYTVTFDMPHAVATVALSVTH